MSSPSGSPQRQSILIPLSKITASTNDSREIFKSDRSEIRDHQTPSFSARTRRRKLHAYQRFDVQNRGVDFALCHHSKRRREPLPVQPATKLSQLLRIMGAHLDKNAARTFAIFWTATSVVVDYRRAGGYADRLRLSPEKIADTIGGSFHRVLTALPKR